MAQTSIPPSAPIQTRQFRRRLARTMLIVLLPLTLLPVLVMGTSAFFRARNLLREQVSTQLISIAELQDQQVDALVLRKQIRLGLATHRPPFKSAMQRLLASSPANQQEGHDQALKTLRHYTQLDSDLTFNQFLITDQDGVIIAATDSAWEGMELSEAPFYPTDVGKPMSRALYSPSPLYDQELVILTSEPFFDSEGNFTASIFGVTESLNIMQSLESTSLAQEEANSYFISPAGDFIGIDRIGSKLVAFQPSTEQAQTLLALSPVFNAGSEEGESVIVDSISAAGDPVTAVYTWLPHLEVALVIEVPQEVIFGQLASLTNFTLLLLLGTTIAIGLITWLGTRQLVHPILQVADGIRAFTQGNWTSRASVERDDEIGLLAHTFNQMADELTRLYVSLEEQVEARSRQIQTAAEVARAATSATELDVLLRRTVELIVERFGHYHASIFLLDQPGERAVLREATGKVGQDLKAKGHSLTVGGNSIIGWVTAHNQPRVASDVSQDPIHFKNELLPETRSEAAVPIAIGSHVLGALDVQSLAPDAFDPESVAALQTVADQIASAIQNIRLREAAQVDLQETSMLYRAGRDIAMADSEERVFQAVADALEKSSHTHALFIAERDGLRLYAGHIQDGSPLPEIANWIPARISRVEVYAGRKTPLLIANGPSATHFSDEFRRLAQQLGWQSVAYMPVTVADQLAALIVLADYETGRFSHTALQPYTGLIELTAIAIERVNVRQAIHKRLAELQTLSSISQIITSETNLQNLYELIFRQMRKIMGDVAFLIALHDSQSNQIEIPFAYEQGQLLHIDPLPLGQGLISHVIRTRQPLLLIEDVEKRARELGAMVVGKPAKSWLGVPLLVADEVIGALAVQDPEQERRFNVDDMRLMSTLASQIAIVVRNARLIEEARQSSLQLEIAMEIAREVTRSLDLDELLQNAIDLIGERFDVYHAAVFLLDRSGKNAVIRQASGEVGHQLRQAGYRVPVGSPTLIGQVTAGSAPIGVDDLSADGTFKPNPLLPDSLSELGIPLKVGDRLLGALDVQSKNRATFDPQTARILQIFADQLAIAIANAEFFQKTQDHLVKHRALHEITTRAAASTSVEETLERAADGLSEALGTGRVAIYLLDEEGHHLELATTRGLEKKDVRQVQIPLGVGVLGQVAADRQPQRLNDVQADPHLAAQIETAQSLLALPLTYRDELFGVLQIESDEYAAYDADDVEIMGSLASTLAAIIANTRIIERQQLLFEVTSKIRRSASMQNVMETTVKELSRVLGARRARIQVGFRPETTDQGPDELQGNGRGPAEGGTP